MSQLSLVTGGNGFVGRALVDALLARGDSVRVVDLAPGAGRSDVEYLQADITDAATMDKACEGVGAVFHNASVVHTKNSQVDLIWKINFEGTKQMLASSQKQRVRRFVYVSSGSVVYEGKDIENGDESLPYATTDHPPYAASKREAEKYVLQHNGAGEVATVALRPHVVFGPGDNRFLPALLKHAKGGRLKFQVGRKNWLSDYTYVSNLIDALLLADVGLQKSASELGGKAFFITNGEPMPFWGFVALVLERLKFPPIKVRLPGGLVYAIAAVKETFDTMRGGTLNNEDGLTRFAIRYMCTHHYFNIDRARQQLGYDPKVSVAQGIELTCKALEAVGQA
jgi:nucleoside-diphosphate-sugar epimerase